MSENVESVTHEILKSIQESILRLEKRVVDSENKLGKKIDELTATMVKFKRDMAGTIVIMRATAGDFDQRVSQIEERMDALEQNSKS